MASAQNSVCPVPVENKIIYMGSSVCLGYNATNMGGPFDFYQSFDFVHKGYAFDYAVLEHDRFTQGKGGDWKFSNISIGGNNTPLIMARWKKDLLPQCGRYVVYGLSLANEGIMTTPGAFDQFKTNMTKLIQDARDSGMIPLVTNNYANNDFTPAIYAKIIAMDLLIHEWNVPSINILGSLDDGAGHWAPGFFSDAGHPNDKGYQEMVAAFVPSLFDALKDGKPRPQKKSIGFVKLKTGSSVSFVPEAGLRSFTVILDVRTSATGSLLEYKQGAATGGLLLDATGVLAYQSAKTGIKTKGSSKVNDGAWHTLAFTHYAATAKTILYVDAVKQAGPLVDSINPADFKLGGAKGPDTAEFRNLLFYRSGMTQVEMDAIHTGSFLQSSLEIYAPLEGQGKTLEASIANTAQSKNVLTSDAGPTGNHGRFESRFQNRFESSMSGGFNLILNDGGENLRLDRVPETVRLYDLSGAVIGSMDVHAKTLRWNPGIVGRGVYLLELGYPGAKEFRKIAF